jgi:hypothetical protein
VVDDLGMQNDACEVCERFKDFDALVNLNLRTADHDALLAKIELYTAKHGEAFCSPLYTTLLASSIPFFCFITRRKQK